jgi:hypothetical protein
MLSPDLEKQMFVLNKKVMLHSGRVVFKIKLGGGPSWP